MDIKGEVLRGRQRRGRAEWRLTWIALHITTPSPYGWKTLPRERNR
jgi:hypothetical protein